MKKDQFLYLKQGGKPVDQYIREFCKLCKYGTEFVKTEKDKCRRFKKGLSDELKPFFTVSDIENFQVLQNKAIETEASVRASERRREGGSWKGKRSGNDDSRNKSKKGKFSKGGYSQTSSDRPSYGVAKSQSFERSTAPVIYVESPRSQDRLVNTPLCKMCHKPHDGPCRKHHKLCYGCGASGHFIRDCPGKMGKAASGSQVQSTPTQAIQHRRQKQGQSGNSGKKGSRSNVQTHQ